MGRYLVLALGVGFGLALNASPAAAQTHVDIGVFTPTVGARVVVGAPRVYVPGPVVYAPRPRVVYAPRVIYAPPPRVVYVPSRVYVVERGYRHDRGRHVGWDRHPRGRYVRAAHGYGYRDDRYRRR